MAGPGNDRSVACNDLSVQASRKHSPCPRSLKMSLKVCSFKRTRVLMINNQRLSLVSSPQVKDKSSQYGLYCQSSTAMMNRVKAGCSSRKLPLTWEAVHWPCQDPDEACGG